MLNITEKQIEGLQLLAVMAKLETHQTEQLVHLVNEGQQPDEALAALGVELTPELQGAALAILDAGGGKPQANH